VEVAYLRQALDDLDFWRKSGNKKIQSKISKLIESIKQDHYKGLGKPEPLKYDLAGKWSRRINQEHRLVYEVEGNRIFIYSLRGHYQ
jgi:toxin YoeB